MTSRRTPRQADLAEDGWLLVCSDGLWNYCSDAADLQRLVHETVARLGATGHHPPALAQALTDFANESGGIDNITVALARVGDTHTVETPETKDTPDGSVHRRGLPERVPARRRDRRARDRSRHVPGRGPGGGRRAPPTRRRSSSSTPPVRWARTASRRGRAAATAALNEIIDGTWFAVIAGNHVGTLVFPYPGGPQQMVRMDPSTRQAAIASMQAFRADGGTAMGTWLAKARDVFSTVPQATQRHAILLTDGANEHETPDQLTRSIHEATGAFQCDCRGLGDRWQVDEVRRIASALLGTVDLIPAPQAMAAEFQSLVRKSMARASRTSSCGCGRRRARRPSSSSRWRRTSRTSPPAGPR